MYFLIYWNFSLLKICFLRYLPAAWRSDNVEQLPDQGKEEINRINKELVAKLKETDSAFSLGKIPIGLHC